MLKTGSRALPTQITLAPICLCTYGVAKLADERLTLRSGGPFVSTNLGFKLALVTGSSCCGVLCACCGDH